MIEFFVFENSIEIEFNEHTEGFGIREKSIRKEQCVSTEIYPDSGIKVSLSNGDSLNINAGSYVAFKNPDTGNAFESNEELHKFLKETIR